MYAAHAKKQKEETSQSQLKECLELMNRARSDNDRFSALLEITHHVCEGSFTDTDRGTAVQAADSHLLASLINTNSLSTAYPSDFYKSIALSVLATLSIDQSVMCFPEIKDFMCLVNDVLSQRNRHTSKKTPKTAALHKSMCRDCEEIVYNISHSQKGVDFLMDCGTASSLLDYVPFCEHTSHILSTIASVLRYQGDTMFIDCADKLHDALTMAVDKFGQGSNLSEKTEYAKILTSFLTGFSMIEVSVHSDWVVPLATTIQKLIVLKLHPDDCECMLHLVQALVGAVGPGVLDPQVTGSFQFLNAVVARLSVEVYMMLDGIGPDNASERHSELDGVYKLLSGAVQCAASLEEDADADSVITIYKKLVDIRDTIIEFLCSVSNQEVGLPRNHSVVLISVRALAAMLTEITEEPTQNLLKLLPFFNLLCQAVEYSDDVILEVKNATQAALENIKMMSVASLKDEQKDVEMEHQQQERTFDAASSSDISDASGRSDTANKHEEALVGFEDLSLSSKASNNSKTAHTEKSKKGACPESSTQTSEKSNGEIYNSYHEKPLPSSCKQSEDLSDLTAKKPPSHKNVSLNADSIEEFKVFQENVLSQRAKSIPHAVRRVTFSGKGKKSSLKSIESSSSPRLPPWTPGPDDVLGYLLPAYMFLLDSEEAFGIMAASDSFQVVVNFLQKALANLLEGKETAYPENMTVNALTLVEQVHRAYPETAIKMQSFHDMFEIFMLSVPNFVNLQSPSPRVCLKLIEVSLTAHQVQMMGRNRNTSNARLKHSQPRFFKAVVEYIKSTYQIRQHKKKPPSLVIAKHLRKIWSSLEESWTICIIGLSQMVYNIEELQDVLMKSSLLAEFLMYLTDCQVSSLEELPDEANMIVESLLPLVECGAEASDRICEMLLYNKGLDIARKFNFNKLGKHLMRHSKKAAT